MFSKIWSDSILPMPWVVVVVVIIIHVFDRALALSAFTNKFVVILRQIPTALTTVHAFNAKKSWGCIITNTKFPTFSGIVHIPTRIFSRNRSAINGFREFSHLFFYRRHNSIFKCKTTHDINYIYGQCYTMYRKICLLYTSDAADE